MWFGLAATGFAILFNVPSRTLLPIFIMGALGGITRNILHGFHINIIVCTLMGSTLVGLISIPFAHWFHAPPPIFAIPSVIPMVPGILAYETMLGLINMASDDIALHNEILAVSVHNGLKVMFILICLSAGVALPMLITRKDSARQMRFWRR